MLDGSPDMVTQHQNLRDILGGTVELNNIGTGKIISDFLRDLRDRLWMDLRDSADCKSTGVSPSQIAGQTAAVWSFGPQLRALDGLGTTIALPMSLKL